MNLIHPPSPLQGVPPRFLFPPTSDERTHRELQRTNSSRRTHREVDTDEGGDTARTPVKAWDPLECLHCRTFFHLLESLRQLGFGMDMSTQQEYPGLKDGEISTGVSPLPL